jgi:hypothetical protein
MSDDEQSKIERIRLEELARLEDTGKVILQANEALVVHELRRVLERQAESDIIIEEMRGIVDTLAVGHVLAIEEIKKIKDEHNLLVRQQAELRERQELIASLCDGFSEKLEKESDERLRLATEVADRD